MTVIETAAVNVITVSSIRGATASVMKRSPGCTSSDCSLIIKASKAHDMAYSTDDIAEAMSLQSSKYILGAYRPNPKFFVLTQFSVDDCIMGRIILIYPRPLSNSLIQTYDYTCSLHEEGTFLLRSPWSKMKGLYIVTRYLPFVFLATNLSMYFTPNENSGICRVLENTQSGLGMVLTIVSETFFILRTYVLWNRNRILLVAILSTFFVSSQLTHNTQASGESIRQTFLVASFSILFTTDVAAAYATSTIQGITVCYQSSTSFQYFIPFLLLSVSELGLMILTLIRAMQNWRINSSHLYVVLVNHNIFYYACGFLFSVMNIITPLLLQDSYQTILNSVQFIMLAILATRMHLHLWQANQHPHDSTSALVHIPMSNISFANPTV
ncbi:uncharacterized protein HD556DRAFT_1474813 [Suillus plorans]|uniref:DUF6533 domain-containing protein n=1 Tax=Suillus plorans TaxID=116603 RepID=A0A9P7ASK9_9AGAM|nr:uncharacterized protein HD556DRAFT_1474813 [Suillus plorans]KAG1794602.1 hypothetical protein HD556DRAFT_1474813 [Suillus plorans]